MKIKITILFLSLLLPVVIFIFLKSFGKNEFEVKPLFQDSVSNLNNCSPIEYHAPYFVPDSIMLNFHISNDSLILILFDDSITENRKKVLVQAERFFKESSLNKIHYVVFNPVVEKTNVRILSVNQDQLLLMKNCTFLLNRNQNAALVDSKRRIMGQYDLTDLDEADRLIMEVKIILKQY